MILYGPEHWDQNEWFVLAAHLIGLLIVKLLPKRYPKAIVVLLSLYSFTFARIVDELLAGPPFDLYDINDTHKWEFFDLMLYAVYCYSGYLFIYLHDLLTAGRWYRKWYSAVYILVWECISILTEWFGLQFEVFKYKGWSLLYSVPTYLLVLCTTLWFHSFIKKEYAKLAARRVSV